MSMSVLLDFVHNSSSIDQGGNTEMCGPCTRNIGVCMPFLQTFDTEEELGQHSPALAWFCPNVKYTLSSLSLVVFPELVQFSLFVHCPSTDSQCSQCSEEQISWTNRPNVRSGSVLESRYIGADLEERRRCQSEIRSVRSYGA